MTAHSYSDEAQGVIAAVIAGDVCPDCQAPNHLRHFDDCPRHPENLTGAPASRVVDALSGEVAASGAEHPVLAANAKADERIAEHEALKAERDLLFEQRDTWMQTAYRFGRLDIETRRQLAVAERERDAAVAEAERLTARNDALCDENAQLACRVHELESEES